MQPKPEIYFVTIIGIILGLLLVGFIVMMLFLYRRRQEKQEQEIARVRNMYERETLRSQLEIQESTLRTISQELHDNIGQMLSVVKLSLSALPLEKEHPAYELTTHSREVLNKAIMDLSNLTKTLHTDRITEIGLVDSIRFELASVKNAGLLQVQFSVSGSETHLPEQKSIFLYRMFQEILNNVLKHSQATGVIVSLSYRDDGSFVMKVADNGIGFNVVEKQNAHTSATGVGLKSIFNRAMLIGATIDVDSEANKGTHITVQLDSTEE